MTTTIKWIYIKSRVIVLPGIDIKAEALRQVQLEMIRGQTRIENGCLFRPNGDSIKLPLQLAGISKPTLQHPYYWSAFNTIGSPWEGNILGHKSNVLCK